MKSKLLWFSFILLIMGIAFGYFENTFYQYIDEKDVLIESWFMSLSFLCIFIGSSGVFFVAAKATWLAIKNPHNQSFRADSTNKEHSNPMTADEKSVQYQTCEIGTPRDYTEDVYKVYFEVGEYKESALNILAKYLGDDKAHGITKLTHGYELEIPIQCVPDIVSLLCEGGVGIYQIVRYAKTDRRWM